MIFRELSAPQVAHFVPSGDLDAAIQAVRVSGSLWAGGYNSIIPVDAEMKVAPDWLSLVRYGRVDGAEVHEAFDRDSLLDTLGIHAGTRGSGSAVPLISVLARLKKRSLGWRAVHVADGINPADPWYVAYVATLGLKPHAHDSTTLRLLNLRDGLDYGDLVTFEDCTGIVPTPEDLLARLRSRRKICHDALTTIPLPLYAAAKNTGIGDISGPLTVEKPRTLDIGPNIIVVYEPGSGADLALLRHLRSRHGFPSGFPLGVPSTVDVLAAVDHWLSEHAMHLFGMHSSPIAVTSSSVQLDSLQRLFDGRRHFEVVDPQSLIVEGSAPGLHSPSEAHFHDGVATVPSLAATELNALPKGLLGAFGSHMRLTTLVEGRALPPSDTMASDWRGAGLYSRGAIRMVRGEPKPTRIGLPAGLDVLDALARDRGLTCRPSRPGVVAENFLRWIGGLDELQPLMSHEAVALVRALSTRRGTSYVRRQVDRLLRDAELAGATYHMPRGEFEREVLAAARTPDVTELDAIAPGKVASTLRGGGALGAAWLRWALDRRLVTRGIVMGCGYCSFKEWRSFDDLDREILCNSCGSRIEEPYGIEAANFQYRASLPLLQSVDHGVLSHLLAVKFLASYLNPTPSGGSLFGVYPGVEFFERSNQALVGEIDVVVVLSDGRLLLGECKDNAAGLTSDEVNKLRRIQTRLGAHRIFAATLSPSSQCEETWCALAESDDFVLTAEHLFDSQPIEMLAGPSALAWRDEYQVGPQGPSDGYESVRNAFRRHVLGESAQAPHSAVAPWRAR